MFAFLTCEPTRSVAPIHPEAMPVLRADEDEERWLRCLSDQAVLLSQPYLSQLMSVTPASATGEPLLL